MFERAESLVRERNLAGIHQQPDENAANAQASPAPIDGLVGALAAMVPTGIAVVYTAFAVTVGDLMSSRGADERVGQTAAALIDVPLESRDFLSIRWTMLVLTASVAFTLAAATAIRANKTTTPQRSGWRILFEPIVTLIAFVAWGLATPGTPLGAHLVAGDQVFWTTTIAAVGGLALVVAGSTLQRPAKLKSQNTAGAEEN